MVSFSAPPRGGGRRAVAPAARPAPDVLTWALAFPGLLRRLLLVNRSFSHALHSRAVVALGVDAWVLPRRCRARGGLPRPMVPSQALCPGHRQGPSSGCSFASPDQPPRPQSAWAAAQCTDGRLGVLLACPALRHPFPQARVLPFAARPVLGSLCHGKPAGRLSAGRLPRRGPGHLPRRTAAHEHPPAPPASLLRGQALRCAPGACPDATCATSPCAGVAFFNETPAEKAFRAPQHRAVLFRGVHREGGVGHRAGGVPAADGALQR